jgi:hypothetical protein
VNAVKSLWASVQGDPVFMRRVNGWLTMFWIAMIPVSYEIGWLKSVTYVFGALTLDTCLRPLVGLAGGKGRGLPGRAGCQARSAPSRTLVTQITLGYFLAAPPSAENR